MSQPTAQNPGAVMSPGAGEPEVLSAAADVTLAPEAPPAPPRGEGHTWGRHQPGSSLSRRQFRRKYPDDRLYKRDLRPLLLLMIVAVFIIGVIDLLPVLIGIFNAFQLLEFSTLSHWLSAPLVGFRNFREALTGGGGLSVSALRATWHSIVFSVVATAVSLPIGIVAAMSVSGTATKAGKIIRSLYLIPYALPQFSGAFLWRMVFLPSAGLVDTLRRELGLGTHANKLLIGDHSMLVLIGVDVWGAWALVYLFALAGQQTIPDEFYEVAHLNGASRWQKFRYVTYPGIKRPLAVAIVLSTLGHFNNFTLPFVLFTQAPPPGVLVIPTLSYGAAFQIFNFGLANAVAVVGLIIVLVPVLIYIRLIFLERSAK